jgi:hypothetical protein
MPAGHRRPTCGCSYLQDGGQRVEGIPIFCAPFKVGQSGPSLPTPENERLRSVLLLDTGLVQDDRLNWPKWVTEALGAQRTEALAQLSGRVANLQAMTVDESTVDVVLVPLKGQAAKKWEMLGLQRGEDWVSVASADGTTTLAMDEPSEDGMRDPAAAVIYPELHTRLVSWWLVHAWRGVDLLQDTLENLRRWRITSGAVTGRAVVEEAGSLVDEAARLAEAWKVGKAIPADKFKRPEAVRRELEPILLHAGFGSRLKISHKQLQATSVLTLVKKLAKMTDDERFTEWYDWLSDAAHPAVGARIAFASPPMVHDTNAVMTRWYARAPMTVEGGGKREHLEPTIALIVADALIAAGTVIVDVLEQSLAVVDDMGLTTAAATLTDRVYWRNFFPVRGNRPCPCGRGRASGCRHYWGQPTPVVTIPLTTGMGGKVRGAFGPEALST